MIVLFLEISVSLELVVGAIFAIFKLNSFVFGLLGLFGSGQEVIVEGGWFVFIIVFVEPVLEGIFFLFVVWLGVGLRSVGPGGPCDVEHEVVCFHLLIKSKNYNNIEC